MMYLEMSREEAHGGHGWEFGQCIWAPTRNTSGGRWAFWSKILQVKVGDTILHLRGKGSGAAFVGFSTAITDGGETSSRPPQAGIWAFARHFYRANLDQFTPFSEPVPLSEVFSGRSVALRSYFSLNKARANKARNIFFVIQSGKLQCLNGAYLSDVDDELFAALFSAPEAREKQNTVTSVRTDQRLTDVRVRIGQAVFAREVKALYANRCCFPGCVVSDIRFLVASHIARWADHEAWRGELGNGLCLCLMHDKAYEVGLFALSDDYRVLVDPDVRSNKSEFVKDLIRHHREQISLSPILPMGAAVSAHRKRVGCEEASWDTNW